MTRPKLLGGEQPDYNYLKSVFRYLREELEISVPKEGKKLPSVPTSEEMQRYYQAVWKTRNVQDMVLIKTLLYTGVRVSELVNIQLVAFKEVLAMHVDRMEQLSATYLFESSWKRKYTDRGIRKILAKYALKAGLDKSISPHQLRHFLLTWLKKQGIDDALIQPYSGHSSRQALEIYSRLSIGEAQEVYDQVMGKFPL
jgi:integrase/recombinase XerD